MIRIPTEFRWKQANSSDIFGSVFATKNMNFDEEGYVKLSSPAVSVFSEADDTDFGEVLSIGREDEDDFFVLTNDEPFTATISPTAITVAEDEVSGNPSPSANSWGVFWQNRWYVSENTDLKYRAGGTWTDLTLSPTLASEPHPMEVFRNRKTLCIGNGNEVKQINTSHADTTNLVLPSDFTVVGLAYSNTKMGIITVLDSAIAGQNQDAFFFVWDGAGTEAGQGFPIGSDQAVGIVAYRGTWVILTRVGELLVWNGGGFEQLAALPFYFRNLIWGDFINRVGKGANMWVEGDVIYMNLGLKLDQYGKNNEDYLPYCPSGIWCYDPKVGLYHRYSASLTTMRVVTVLQAGVNTTTNVLTANSGSVPSTSSIIRYSSATTVIGGLSKRDDYYAIKLSASTFSLATSKENAEAGIAIDLTDAGGATHYFLAFEAYDYGTSYLDDAGAVSLMGVQSPAYDHLIFGAEIPVGETNSNHLQVTVPNLINKGYFVTSKIFAARVEDTYQYLILPFRPLKEGDSIQVKVKSGDLLGLPVISSQDGATCTWTSNNEFYVTADLSKVKEHFDNGEDIECEVIAGYGAGDMSKVTSVAYENGVYSFVLEDSIVGAASGRSCDVQFDNWKHLTIVTNESTTEVGKGYIECAVNTTSKWSIYKVILMGSEVTIEPMQLVTKTHK